jgi:penicillin-binding protein 2
MKRESKRTGVFTRRALIVGGAQLAALGFLAARLYQVQVVEGSRYATLAEANRVSTRLIAPPRGRLLDRSGTVIAGNRQNWRALFIAELAEDAGVTLDTFARFIPISDSERARIERDLRRRRRYSGDPARVPHLEDMARIEVNAPELPGVLVDVGTTRQYLFGPGWRTCSVMWHRPMKVTSRRRPCWPCRACARRTRRHGAHP